MSNKITAERNQRALLELASQPGNDACADCKARNPRWASYNLGIFICVNCASIHRKIGTHVSKVKSLTLDSWSKEQLENMRQKGNIKSNTWYNPNEDRNPLPTNYLESERDSELELYIRSKYEHKKFLDRSAVVASHLGPSRSFTTLSARAQSTPAIQHVPAPSTAPPGPPSKASTLAATPEYRPATALPSSSFEPTQIRPTRSVSQPLSVLHQPQRQQIPPQKSSNPIWDDLISLQTPNPTPSLPLQYQAAPPAPASFASPNQALQQNTHPFSNLPLSPGYPSAMNAAGGYSPAGAGMNLPQVDMTGGGPANPFQQMQQQAQLGFNPGTPSMYIQGGAGGGGGSPHPFGQAYPLAAGSAHFGGGMGGASPMQPSTPFQPAFAQLPASTSGFQPSPQAQRQQQQHPGSFSQQPMAFQQQQQTYQFFPSQPQVQAPGPMQHQQAQQFFQPQPQPVQQQTIVAQPFVGTPSPFDQQQQAQQAQAQMQMYGQGGGFGGWGQGGQQWGGM